MKALRRLTAKELSYHYPGVADNAVDAVDCYLERGQIAVLTGLSASGKTTLGKLLKGLLRPTSGRVEAKDRDGNCQAFTQKRLLNAVGWAGAHPEVQLFASTVAEDVGFGAMNLGLAGRELAGRIDQALTDFGLKPEVLREKHPLALSGGEKRRIALAGIIVMDAPFYIFDEPTAGLDSEGCEQFIASIRELKRRDRGILWITHDPRFYPQVADEVWRMVEGKLAG